MIEKEKKKDFERPFVATNKAYQSCTKMIQLIGHQSESKTVLLRVKLDDKSMVDTKCKENSKLLKNKLSTISLKGQKQNHTSNEILISVNNNFVNFFLHYTPFNHIYK